LSGEKNWENVEKTCQEEVTKGKLPEKRPAAKKAKSPWTGLFAPVA